METEGERGGFLLFVAFSLFSHSFDGLGQSSLTLLSRRRLGLICPQAIGRPAAAMAAAADVSGYSRRRPRHLRRGSVAASGGRAWPRCLRRPPAFPLAGVRLPTRADADGWWSVRWRRRRNAFWAFPPRRLLSAAIDRWTRLSPLASLPPCEGPTGPQRRHWPIQSLAEGTNKERKVRERERAEK